MPRPAPPKPKMSWRLALRVTLWTAIAAGMAYGAKEVNSFLLRDPHFDLSSLEIRGAVYTNRARIQNVFAADLGNSVFGIPLAERRRRLLAIDWVGTASVSRVWPNRIVVAIAERRPVAFAKVPIAGTLRYRMALIDAEGVLLSLPPRVRFRLPVLSGVAEEQSESERALRVRAMQHLLEDLGPQAKDISEVNAASTQDLRITTALDHHGVELWLGDQHFRSRYLNFLDHYAEIHRHSETASVFDLRFDDRILAK